MFATILKFVVLFALAPVWWPILKELFFEVEAALIEEGGLFGRPPTKEELSTLREKYANYQDPLVSIPWANAREEIERQREAKRNKGKASAGASQPKQRNVSSGPVRGPSGRW